VFANYSNTPSSKPDWPPLLAAGFHPMSIETVNKICVTDFPDSKTRQPILADLEKLIVNLINCGISGTLWVDGSFLTQKTNPEDADTLIEIASDVFDKLTQQQHDLLQAISQSHIGKCHVFVIVVYPTGHPAYGVSDWDRSYWVSHFGFNRLKNQYKGIASIELAPKGEQS